MPLHLFRECLELVPETGEYLPLTGDEVGDVPVRAEIADDDDAVVGQRELFQTFLVSPINDVDEDGLAVATEQGVDDIGADFVVVGVVESVVAHILYLLDYTTKVMLFFLSSRSPAQPGQPTNAPPHGRDIRAMKHKFRFQSSPGAYPSGLVRSCPQSYATPGEAYPCR